MHEKMLFSLPHSFLFAFCLTIQELVSSLSSEFNVFYIDDGTIGGNLADLQADFQRIKDQGQALGLYLNVDKSKLISYDESAVTAVMCAFSGLQFTRAHQATLLGSPLGQGAMDICLEVQLHQLKTIGERLCHLQTHDAITILRHLFSIGFPKLLHILCTSPAFTSQLLVSWDNLLMYIVSRITSINFRMGDSSWLQVTLPVRSGGLGFTSASNLVPSAFLASADGASELIQQLLPAMQSRLLTIPREGLSSVSMEGGPTSRNTPPNLPQPPEVMHGINPRLTMHLFDTLLASCFEDPVSRS